MAEKKPLLLYVEDDEVDALLFRLNLEKKKPEFECVIVDSYKKMQEFLMEERTPDLFLLDINLPMVSGMEILVHLKQSEDYRDIPVIMYSTSNYPPEIKRAYELGAENYVIKSSSLDETLNFIGYLEENILQRVRKN